MEKSPIDDLTCLLVLYDQRCSTAAAAAAGSRLLDAVVVQLVGPGEYGVSAGRRGHRGRVDGELRRKEGGADVRNVESFAYFKRLREFRHLLTENGKVFHLHKLTVQRVIKNLSNDCCSISFQYIIWVIYLITDQNVFLRGILGL